MKSLRLIKYHSLRRYEGRGCIATQILSLGTTWALSGEELHIPAALTPGNEHWTGGLVLPVTGLNALVKRKSLACAIEPRFLSPATSVSIVTMLTELSLSNAWNRDTGRAQLVQLKFRSQA
jgi:hypothetical protein